MLGTMLVYKMFSNTDPKRLNQFIKEYGMNLTLHELLELQRFFHTLWGDMHYDGEFIRNKSTHYIEREERLFELKRIVDVFFYGRIYLEPELKKEYFEFLQQFNNH